MTEVQFIDPPAAQHGAPRENVPSRPAASAKRHFLFVTAPFGPFSRRLADRLRADGAHFSRVLLNGGDLVDWGWRHAAPYRGRFERWELWIEGLLRRLGITDLVVHGDGHAYGRTAIRVAKALGLKVHIFEQGYFRPHWITLERDGANGHSGLPRDPAAYRVVAVKHPQAQVKPVGKITPANVLRISIYHFAAFALAGLFPRYRNPYAYRPSRQAVSHTWTYARQRLAKARAAKALRQVLDDDGPLFVVLLQRPGDSQLTMHSSFGAIADFIEEVVTSFAAHAPEKARLLVKSHPLDHGLERHEKQLADCAHHSGVDARVFFADSGHLPTILRRSEGVVTINSTGALAAMEIGRPCVVLGEAVFDMPGLTHQAGLNSFWSAAEPPDKALFGAFQTVVMARTQINGAFSTKRGMEMAVNEAARRLLQA